MRLLARFYLMAYVFFTLMLLIAPWVQADLAAFPSQGIHALGAQNTAGNWMINTVFIGMGMAIIVYGYHKVRSSWLGLGVLIFFGLCFSLLGVFHVIGSSSGYLYNYTTEALHWLFYLLSMLSFFLLWLVLAINFKGFKYRMLSLIVPLLILVYLLLKNLYPESYGWFQSILFIVCLGWIFYALTADTKTTGRGIPKKVENHINNASS